MLGNYYDTDATQAGTQPPPPRPEAEKATQPGRLVSRLEKAVEDLDTWAAEWAGADTSKLRGVQRERAKKAMADLKAKVAAVEALLG
jgi:hypothetical protein